MRANNLTKNLTSNKSTDRIETNFEEPGSLRPPAIVGRVVRIAVGVWMLAGTWSLIFEGLYPRLFLGYWQLPNPPRSWTFYLFLALMFWVTPYVINVGYRKNWRRKPQFLIFAITLVLLAINLVFFGTSWTGALPVFTFAWMTYIAIHLGISFIIAGIIATPGCEMRAFAHLWGKISGNAAKEHYCPGPLDPLDRWEWSQSHEKSNS